MEKPKRIEIVQISLADFFAPCVYAWRRNGAWLYVGQSRKGLARLASHHVIVPGEVWDTDELLVWRMPASELSEFESQLIRANSPLYNKALVDKPKVLVKRSVIWSPPPSAEDAYFYKLSLLKGRETVEELEKRLADTATDSELEEESA